MNNTPTLSNAEVSAGLVKKVLQQSMASFQYLAEYSE